MTMPAQPAIPEPILNYCLGLLPDGEKRSYFGAWRDLGQYWVWSAAGMPDDARLKVREKTSKGIVELNAPGNLMHSIAAGVQHQVAHVFGYWLESDSDRIWIQIARPDGFLYAMIWGGGSGAHLQERLLWLCPKCGAPLGERSLSRARPSIEVFLSQQLAAVRQFNSESAERTCRACRFIHPEAYGFDPQNDAAAEKLARQQW